MSISSINISSINSVYSKTAFSQKGITSGNSEIIDAYSDSEQTQRFRDIIKKYSKIDDISDKDMRKMVEELCNSDVVSDKEKKALKASINDRMFVTSDEFELNRGGKIQIDGNGKQYVEKNTSNCIKVDNLDNARFAPSSDEESEKDPYKIDTASNLKIDFFDNWKNYIEKSSAGASNEEIQRDNDIMGILNKIKFLQS